MSLASEVIGAVGGITGLISAVISWQQWRKTNSKIAMLSDASRAAEILPAWYTSRMMTDHRLFGILDGHRADDRDQADHRNFR